eukprot:gene75-444_t
MLVGKQYFYFCGLFVAWQHVALGGFHSRTVDTDAPRNSRVVPDADAKDVAETAVLEEEDKSVDNGNLDWWGSSKRGRDEDETGGEPDSKKAKVDAKEELSKFSNDKFCENMFLGPHDHAVAPDWLRGATVTTSKGENVLEKDGEKAMKWIGPKTELSTGCETFQLKLQDETKEYKCQSNDDGGVHGCGQF